MKAIYQGLCAKLRKMMGVFLLSLFSISAYTSPLWCPVPLPEGGLWIYEDSLSPAWSITGGWSSTTNASAYGVGQNGTYTTQTVFSSSWGGTGFYKAGNIDLSQVTGLTFRVRMEQSTADLLVGMHRTATNAVDKWVSVSQYIKPYQTTPFVTGQWYTVHIPLFDMQLSSSDNTIKGFFFMSSVAGTMYLEDLVLINSFLKFPLACSNATCSGTFVDYRVSGAYTPSSIISVVDHKMISPYVQEDGVVLAWNGEKGEGTAVNQGCYQNSTSTAFSLGGLYVSDTACGITKINYDSHPGFDFKAAPGTPVKAAASGTIVSYNNGSGVQKCIPKGISSAGCNAWGAVGIDHGNGYISQYLHLDSVVVNSGDVVTQGQLIGYSGNKNPVTTNMGPHLHFEVLNKTTGSSVVDLKSYKIVDPYGWTGVGQDPLEKEMGIQNFRLWK